MTLAVGDNRLYFSAYKWNSRCFEIPLLATCCEQIHYASEHEWCVSHRS